MSRRRVLGGLVAALLASPDVLADDRETCDRALQLEGPTEAVAELRAALRDTSLHATKDGACAGALVSLREHDGGYTVALALAGSRIERDVTTMAAAATWVEGWLTGAPDLPLAGSGPDAPAVSAAFSPAEAPRSAMRDEVSPTPPPPQIIFVEPSVQLALVGTGSAGTDGSAWGGAELFGRVHMTRSLWMGAALGVDGDSGLSGPTDEYDDTSRVALRASARAGGALRLSSRVGAVLGGGVGVLWGTAVRAFPDDDEEVEQGGFFLEAHADAHIQVSRQFSLIGGIAGRGRFLSSPGAPEVAGKVVPDAMPPLTGELRLGAGWDFGGGP